MSRMTRTAAHTQPMMTTCSADKSGEPAWSENIHWKNHVFYIWAPSSEFVSSSIPSWQILTAHAQPFRGARDLAFCLKVPLDSLLVWASSEGSGETARMRRLAWTFAARTGDKYQIRLTRSIYQELINSLWATSFYLVLHQYAQKIRWFLQPNEAAMYQPFVTPPNGVR